MQLYARHGRRHREAVDGGAAGRPAPPARRLAGDAHGQRRRTTRPRPGPSVDGLLARRPVGGRGRWLRASTCARCSTTSTSPGPTRRYGLRSRRELARVGARAAARPARLGRPGGRREDPARRTGGASSGPSRWSSCAAPTPPTLPEPRAHYPDVTLVGLAVPRPELAARIEDAGRPDVGARAWSTRCAGWRSRTACGRDAPRAARSATPRCCASSTGVVDERTAREETVTATRRFARRQESWFRRDPRIHWLGAGESVARPLRRRTALVSGSLRSTT